MDYNKKAEILIEALPYFKMFNGSVVVIKYGGSAMIDETLKQSVMEDIALMKYIGMEPIIVHGGGKEITSQLKKVGKKSQFVNGYRVTDEETMEITEMVLAGKVGKSIVRHLHILGVNAVGISGKDGQLFLCEQTCEGMGQVGNIVKVDPRLLNTLMSDGFVPVVSPIGLDTQGNTYNINADEAASAIAKTIKAEKLFYLSDVPGVLETPTEESSLISALGIDTLNYMMEKGMIKGGMIPKLRCCKEALENGVEGVHILDGRQLHSLLIELFTDQGIGTMICHSVPSEKKEVNS